MKSLSRKWKYRLKIIYGKLSCTVNVHRERTLLAYGGWLDNLECQKLFSFSFSDVIWYFSVWSVSLVVFDTYKFDYCFYWLLLINTKYRHKKGFFNLCLVLDLYIAQLCIMGNITKWRIKNEKFHLIRYTVVRFR